MVRNIEVQSIEDLSSRIPDLPIIDDIHAKFSDYLGQMQEESNAWLEYAESVKHTLDSAFVDKMIEAGASLAASTTCSATGSRLTRDDVTYSRSRKAIRAPSTRYPTNTYKTDRTGTTPQGNLTTVGRMGGLGGWSLDGNMIISALASYTHNFVAMLLAFFNRALLPLKIPTTLPNLVLAETRRPSQFVPPLSMAYILPPLTPVMMSTIKISAPVDSSFFVVQRKRNKEVFAQTQPIEITSGENAVNIMTQLYPGENSGIFDIEPYNAPSGLKIESVSTIPPMMPNISKVAETKFLR